MFVKKSMQELNRLAVETVHQSEKIPIIIILDDVRSMHNVGSTFRTCDAFAIKELWLCGYTPQPPHRDIHKTALGATETVAWKHFNNTIDAANAAKKAGYTLVAIEQAQKSTLLNEFQWTGSAPLALIFGNEVEGVNDDVLKIADHCIEIPQWGAKHSLNISVSLGIVLWELVRNLNKA